MFIILLSFKLKLYSSLSVRANFFFFFKIMEETGEGVGFMVEKNEK